MFANLLLTAVVLTAGGGQAPRIQAQAAWPYPAATIKGKESVLRSPAALVAVAPPKEGETPGEAASRVLTDVTRALKVKEIDWKTQMLVLVRVDRAHPFYPLNFNGLQAKGLELNVRYTYYAPVAARPQDKSPTPVVWAQVALVPRTAGEVKFESFVSYPK